VMKLQNLETVKGKDVLSMLQEILQDKELASVESDNNVSKKILMNLLLCRIVPTRR
jgi:hypothetical protein